MFNRLLSGRAQVRVLPGTSTTSHRAGVKTQRFLPDQTLCAAYRAALLALTGGNPQSCDPFENPDGVEQGVEEREIARIVTDAVLMTIFGEDVVPSVYLPDLTRPIASMRADLDTEKVWGVRYLAHLAPETGDPLISWHSDQHLAQHELDECQDSRPAVLVSMAGPVTTHQETIRY